MIFHSRQSFFLSFFHVSLGLPAPCLPSICISHAVLTAPLEPSACPNQGSLLSLKMRSRTSSSSYASSSLNLTVATSSGLINMFNPFKPTGLTYPHHLEEFISNSREPDGIFYCYFNLLTLFILMDNQYIS